jgi:hypothetical protein
MGTIQTIFSFYNFGIGFLDLILTWPQFSLGQIFGEVFFLQQPKTQNSFFLSDVVRAPRFSIFRAGLHLFLLGQWPSSTTAPPSLPAIHRTRSFHLLPQEALSSGDLDYRIVVAPPPQHPWQQLAMALPAPSAPPQVTGRRRCGVRAVRMGCFGDPEMKRRRRVAGYKAYAVKGKVKESLRRGLRWFKRKCSRILSL